MTDSSTSVQFAPWATEIENDRLELYHVSYGRADAWVELPPENVRLEVGSPGVDGFWGLTAFFLSLDQRAVFRLTCEGRVAFRVLDERGLLELWAATEAQGGRPGLATFKIRNHGWSRESVLTFETEGQEGYSYMVASDFDCLEVVSREAPTIERVGPAAVLSLDSGTPK